MAPWLSVVAAVVLGAGDVRIETDFPGGNLRIEGREGDTFVVAPDLRDTQAGQWWFWWCFRLKAPAGRAVTVEFRGKDPIGVRGPAMSSDGGGTWTWMGADSVRETRRAGVPGWSFTARVPEGAEEARFAFCPTYVGSDLEAWLEKHRGDPALAVETLCRSRAGRRVELVRAGCLEPGRARGVVLLTSRHHACEAMATFALEGFLDAVLADDAEGRRWRAGWEVVAVPFMDRDGVEAGDQGKNRAPRDHNRDYNERPVYPEVAAWMARGTALAGRVAASIDLHCPTIRGEWNDRVYLVGSSNERTSDGQRAFAGALERGRTGPLPFDGASGFLPYGSAWNTAANTVQGRSNGQWAQATFPNARLTTTIEIAYADARGAAVTPASARALGRDLARALRSRLEDAKGR